MKGLFSTECLVKELLKVEEYNKDLPEEQFIVTDIKSCHFNEYTQKCGVEWNVEFYSDAGAQKEKKLLYLETCSSEEKSIFGGEISRFVIEFPHDYPNSQPFVTCLDPTKRSFFPLGKRVAFDSFSSSPWSQNEALDVFIAIQDQMRNGPVGENSLQTSSDVDRKRKSSAQSDIDTIIKKRMEEEKETQTKLEEARKAFEKAQEEHASKIITFAKRSSLEKVEKNQRGNKISNDSTFSTLFPCHVFTLCLQI